MTTRQIMPPKQRRRFTLLERVILRWATHHCCAICGSQLSTEWHADHVLPFSRGGATTVTNGQATCPQCNLKKGATMPVTCLMPWNTDLRDWQHSFYTKYSQNPPEDCLLVAVPGAGKTRAACRVIHGHLASGSVTHIIVACHSRHLMSQWIESANLCGGIQLGMLDTKGILEGFAPDVFHGHVTTYHTLSGPTGQLALMKLIQQHRGRVLAVMDELHHAGTRLPWGVAIENVFESAAYRLLLSGTPFRTDGLPLPFVTYDPQGNCVPFDGYSYAQALTDQVCRRIVFPKYDGVLEYWNGEEIINTTFHDEVTEEKARERLNAAITSDWLDGVIVDAHERLQICRQNGHSDAGGLIVCRDDAHARQVVQRVRRLTGTTAVIATHREEQAHQSIEEFATSTAPWIVAVHMISEGVDIPRLRVGIYATNILTELYFWQFCGRFVRMIDSLECEQDASIFIPSDEVLISYAQHIYQQGAQQLRETAERIANTWEEDEAISGPWQEELLRQRSIHGTGTAEQDGAIFLHGEEVTKDEYQWACRTLPAHLQSESALLAAIIIHRKGQTEASEFSSAPRSSAPPGAKPPPSESLHKQRIRFMHDESELISTLQRVLLDTGSMTTKDSERLWTHLQAHLNRLVGVRAKKQCSLEQFQRRALFLKTLIRAGHYDF